MRYFYAGLLLLAFSATAHAQVRYEWIGGSAGDWTEPANWSPSGIPAAADTAVVGEEGQGTRVVTLTEATTVAGLEIAGLGAVAGDFDLTIIDRFAWSGGGSGFETFRGTGTITNASTSTLHMTEPTTRFQMAAGRTLVNDGLIVWNGMGSWRGESRLVNNGELVLAMGQNDAFGFVFSSLADAFTNSATGLIRRTGSGNARYSAGLVNDGTIRIESGSIDLRGFNATGTVGAGPIEVGAGATLLVSGGNHMLTGSVTGTGAVEISAGTFALSGPYAVGATRFTGFGRLALNGTGSTASLDMTNGELNGSGTLTVTSQLLWSGGSMGGSGTTTLGPSVPLDIGGANIGLKDTRTLRVEGETTWTGDADFSNGTGAVFENAGSFTSSGPGERAFFAGTFRNEGSLSHAGGVLRFNSGMDNVGVVRILEGTLLQTGFNATGGTDTGRYVLAGEGRLEFTGGNRTLTESAEVIGTGTVVFGFSNVTNRATWQPGTSSGILAVDSDWPTPEPESVLEIEIGGTTPGTDFDQLSVTEEAELGGTLRVTFTDGFEPQDGDRFLIVSAATVSGSFDALDLPDGLDAFIDATGAGAELVIGQPVANEDDASEALPTAFALGTAYPNPFAARATVGFDVPTATEVRVVVYDMLGRVVAVLVNDERAAGRYEAVLDARGLPSGVYLVRVTADGFQQTRRVTLLR